jgi:hypothetical protein
MGDENVALLTIEKLDEVPQSVIVINDGHGFKLKFNYSDGKSAKFNGGPLENSFIIDRLVKFYFLN